MRKKLLCFVLVGLLTVGLVPATALASEEGTPGEQGGCITSVSEEAAAGEDLQLDGDTAVLTEEAEPEQKVDPEEAVPQENVLQNEALEVTGALLAKKPVPKVIKEPKGITSVYTGVDQFLLREGGMLSKGKMMIYTVEDDPEGTVTSKIPKAKNAGEYTINYGYIDNQGEFVKLGEVKSVIKQMPIAVYWGEDEFTYDGENHIPKAYLAVYPFSEVTVSVNGKDEAKDAGTYTAVAQFYDPNYVPLNPNKNFVIKKKPVSIEFGETTFVYNGQNQIPEAQVVGLVGEDTCDVSVTLVEDEEAVNVGEYGAIAYALSNPNYRLVMHDRSRFTKFNIIAKEIKVIAEDKEKLYKDADPELTCYAEGLEGDDEIIVEGVIREEGEALGTYPIYVELDPNQNPNYDITLVNGTFTIKPHVYEFIKGMKGCYTKDSGKTLTFKTNGDFALFTGIQINGKNIPANLYTAKDGCTEITLSNALLQKYAVGKFTLTAVYEDGSCDTVFYVANGNVKKAPQTGDSGNMSAWLIVMVAAFAAGAAVVTRRRNAR